MKVPLSHLSSAGRVLSRFNGATTLTMGDIVLSVKAGPVTQLVLFSVVEDLGPYDSIVGWTLLYTMKAVPSTHHQSINYLIESEQVDLQGSQLAARECYRLLVHKREKDKGSESSPLRNSTLIIAMKACCPGYFRRQGTIGSRSPGIHAHKRPGQMHLR